jgi:phospholipid-translocating ATPase
LHGIEGEFISVQKLPVNIGYSCRLLTEDMEEVFIIDGETADVVRKQLNDALHDMNEKSVDDWNVKTRQDGFNSGRVTPLASDDDNFALVVNGCSLVSHSQ